MATALNAQQASSTDSTTTTSTTIITSTSTTYVFEATLPAARSSSAADYTYGLDGVNQSENYFSINSLLIFFGILAAVLLTLRLYKLGQNYIRHVFCAGPGRDEQQFFTRNSTSFWPWIKRHLLYAPLFRKRHNKEIQLSRAVNVGTLPSRLHSSILAAYFLSNLIYCLTLSWSEPVPALLAEGRGRTGCLAAFNLIPTILFALRNNPLISLLRVSYDTFNLIHRGIARIVIVESIAHVLFWAATCWYVDGPGATNSEISESPSYQWGTVAVVIFSTIGVTAWSPIRHAFYETFLNTHRLFAFIALLGVYQHLVLAGLPQTPYLVLAALFWAADWIWRLATIYYYNIRKKERTRVLIEALDNEACRLTFDLVRPWKYRPGCHAHIYLPRISWHSSHPFSIAWSQDHLALPSESVTEEGKEEKAGNEKNTLPLTTSDLDKQAHLKTSVSFIVRARAGFTRTLYTRALSTPSKTLTLTGAIEGPYGGHESLSSYGTVLLFAGGVGITHQIGHLRHLLQEYTLGTVACRNITLIWAIPSLESLSWIRPWMDEILRMQGRRDILRVRICVTKAKQSVTSSTGTVEVLKGRCDVQRCVDEVFLERIGAMVVTVCGPGAFADEVRGACRRRVELGCLDFIEEAFTY